MFKLINLTIGLFAIVKATEQDCEMPITAHGFIQIIFDDREKARVAYLLPGKMSQELEESKEIRYLKDEALRLSQ